MAYFGTMTLHHVSTSIERCSRRGGFFGHTFQAQQQILIYECDHSLIVLQVEQG